MQDTIRQRWSVLASLAIAILCCVCGLAACNTVEGAGEDIESAGDSIQDAAD